VKGHRESYNNAKAGNAQGAAAANFNDKAWENVKLPHDWAVEGEFDKNENISQGYRKRGIGWYRRQFKLDTTDKGRHLEIQFDGIATNATIWFNGMLIHRNYCGYTSMYLDVSALVKFGDEINTIAVRIDADAQEGWWYEGAGIYRHVWLVKRSALHIKTDGVFAQPVKEKDTWKIPAEITFENSGEKGLKATHEVRVLDPSGKTIVSKTKEIEVGSLKQVTDTSNLSIPSPTRWTLENPVLYKVKTVLKTNGVILDSATTQVGFRTVRFDADSGFFLNDKNVKIQGVCNHQDHAGVGVAVPDALFEFRLRKLKEMGVNAYRCAHHPPSAEFLDLCDKMGIMVMDENRNFNISPDYIEQLRWMVRRDRNHPSIILWSVFNEEPMQGTAQGLEMVRRMSAEVKSLDGTRPVTAAMNGGLFAAKNVSQAVDVVGFNYQMQSYDRFHKENPSMKLTSSEDVSAFQIRGEYKTDKAKNIMEDYDTERAVWGSTHRKGWQMIDQRPFIAGAFVWTGFDYRGEPSPFSWPTASSLFGAMDLCGFPKTAFYIHQAQWIKDKPILKITPHWNWPDSTQDPVKVMVISNADSVKLVLNGKTIAGQKVDKYEMNTFAVPFKAGKLEAFAYKGGKEIAKDKIETTGSPFSVRLLSDRPELYGDGLDAMPITVQVVDKKGREVPTAQNLITFTIKGSGRIIGVGNGNPNAHELEKAHERSLFNGLAQVIIQAEQGSETIELVASSEGLKPFTLKIPVKKTEPIPFVSVISSDIQLDDWRVSAFSQSKPNPALSIAENDMNSWLPTKASELQTFSDGKYALYQSSFTLTDVGVDAKAKLHFKDIVGKAEIWLDDELVFDKKTYEKADVNVPFKGQNKKYKLVVLVESETGRQAGLGGIVNIEIK
jgi:beta-galactosidase